MNGEQIERLLAECGPEAVFDALGPVPEAHKNPDPTTRIIDDKTTTRCACDKVVETITMPRRHSGVIPYLDNVCHGCEDRAKGLAPVVCVRCHRVAGRMPPAKDKYGFEIQAGRTYHIEKCPICSPADFALEGQVEPGEVAAKTPIIEMNLFHRQMGVIS